jgi:hypothetical protein
MSDAKDKKDDDLQEVARRLAEWLASVEGAQAMAKAAEYTRRRAAEISQAARFDAKLLQKRVTF